MFISYFKPIILLYFTFALFNDVKCWESNEMQMFDLIEELNENFYSYLGIEQNATVNEIRRAYRKLSLKYHPDRNPNADDSIKFRRIVAIYEILKDDKLRERYDDVLKFGLPDWKMPVFYFRKLRRMSFVESFFLFSLLATAIHYAVLWGIYFERKLNVEDFFRKKKRKSKKTDKNNEINEHLSTIPRPSWIDILPLALGKFSYNFVMATPSTVKMTCQILKHEVVAAVDKKYEKQRLAKENEDEKQRIKEEKQARKERKQAMTKDQREEKRLYEEAKRHAMSLPMEHFHDVPASTETNTQDFAEFKSEPWSDEDSVALIRALVKYPVGVNNRWGRISELVKRPVVMCIAKVKAIQRRSEEGQVPVGSATQNSLGAGVNEQVESSQRRMMYVPTLLTSLEPVAGDSASESDEEPGGDVEYANVVMSAAQRKKQRKKMARQAMQSNPITKTLADDATWERDAEDTSVNGQEHNDGAEEEHEETVTKQRKKGRTKAKYLEPQQDQQPMIWSQVEQKQLEDAMRAFPKGSSERWDRIAQKIPTKTKVQCIERIKALSQIVQQHRSQHPTVETEENTV